MRVLLSFLLVICLLNQGFTQTYDIVLQTDFEGLVTSGSKEELISFIRKGKAVRVGWQLDFDGDGNPDLDHWVPATFITILEGEVFTQINPIYGQGPNSKIPQVEIYADNTKWLALLGTNGKLLNRFIQDEDAIPELVFDDSMNLSEAEKKEIFEQEEIRKRDMKKVNTWKVATFWSILK